MSLGLIVGLALVFLVIVGGVLYFILTADQANSAQTGQISKMVSAQRFNDSEKNQVKEDIFKEFHQARIKREASSKITLEKRLRFARLKLPPLVFLALEIFLSVSTVYLLSIKCNIFFSFVVGSFIGPITMNAILNTLINRRAKRFDFDFAAFLMSLVSLIRTGQNTMTAIETAALGLDQNSLVREEVSLMIERLRLGVPEEQSIGSFAEDVQYTETELFVQALLLSRRVGGNLSETLERLAKQARKRQHFRQSAQAAVGMQRGSIWFILVVMVALEGFLYFSMSEAVMKSIQHPIGWMAWQGGISCILAGLYWVRQITNIKI